MGSRRDDPPSFAGDKLRIRCGVWGALPSTPESKPFPLVVPSIVATSLPFVGGLRP